MKSAGRGARRGARGGAPPPGMYGDLRERPHYDHAPRTPRPASRVLS